MSNIPISRLVRANLHPVRPERDHVLYWMTATRRTEANYGLQRARWHADRLGKPLLVLEALRVGYRWASVRHHRFLLDGMRDNQRALARAGVRCHSYVEPSSGAGTGLLEALAARAAVVVTDDSPTFFFRRMIEAVAPRLTVSLEVVDSCGVVPLRMPERSFTVAHSFRRWLQKVAGPVLEGGPSERPLAGYAGGWAPVPSEVSERWPSLELTGDLTALARALPIDGLAPGHQTGGPVAAAAAWKAFLQDGLGRYGTDRGAPAKAAQSHLSAYLHYGHIGPHQLLWDLFEAADWSPDDLRPVNGKRLGFWGLSPDTEAFLDELLTWRELGHVFCHQEPDHAEYRSLPAWARTTLDIHRTDPRPHLYTHAELAEGATHDPLWNAAQGELRQSGRLHGYLRMLWGKKVLHWTESPEQAFDILLALNNRYALDGRDANSISGVSWVLGRFDRAWGPERPVFGKVRYMTSASTRRKLPVKDYIERWG